MSRYQEIQNELNAVSPAPLDLPKLYFLGDTGAGKTTIIRKLLGTEESKFPTTRQKRTTVAPTEYVICNGTGFDLTVVLKPISEIEGYVDEILKDAIGKFYKDRTKDKIVKNIRQTSDQRFRLYYLLSTQFSEEIAVQIAKLLPALEDGVRAYQQDFPEDKNETGIFVEFVISELGTPYSDIRNAIMAEIQRLTSASCDGATLEPEWRLHKFETASRDHFVKKCKELLSSEIDSISPVIEYARIRGSLKAPWLREDVEAIVIDGEGIGHDTKEAGQLDSRHYDYFYDSDAILLIEESKKPFVAGGKSALKSIFQRGYGDKLFLLFTKLDEVEPYDSEDPTDEDRIEDVRDGLTNVLASLRDDGLDIEPGENKVLFLGSLQNEGMSERGVQQVNQVFEQAHEMSRFQQSFVAPIYDFEMLSAFLVESTRRFNDLYRDMLFAQHWKTVEAFNRRMDMGIDGFRMFTPITDFEEKLNEEMESFIAKPIAWKQEVSDTLKKESLNSIRRQFNKLVIDFARHEIIKVPHQDWNTAYCYSGRGSTSLRRADIEAILKRSVPPYATSERVKDFKDNVKRLLETAISNCEMA
jgi:GTPase SAR1 family protein